MTCSVFGGMSDITQLNFVTILLKVHQHALACTTLYFLVTEAHVCQQFAQRSL